MKQHWLPKAQILQHFQLSRIIAFAYTLRLYCFTLQVLSTSVCV